MFSVTEPSAKLIRAQGGVGFIAFKRLAASKDKGPGACFEAVNGIVIEFKFC